MTQPATEEANEAIASLDADIAALELEAAHWLPSQVDTDSPLVLDMKAVLRRAYVAGAMRAGRP